MMRLSPEDYGTLGVTDMSMTQSSKTCFLCEGCLFSFALEIHF